MFPESSIRKKLWDRVSKKRLYACVDGIQLKKKQTRNFTGMLDFKNSQTELKQL